MSINSINYGASLLGQSVRNINNQLSDLSTQLSTGLKSTNYAGMGVNEGFGVAARSQLANISAFGGTMTNVNTIISAANTALQSLSDTGGQVQSAAAASPQNLTSGGQTIGQQNADSFGKLLPQPLAGWKAEDVQTTSVGAVGFGASTASRHYTNAKGDSVEVQITGDSAMVSQIATFLNNPAMAGAMGKLVRVGNQRAIQDGDGNVKMIVANKFLISVEGSADGASKLAYTQAIDFAKLSRM